MFEKLFTAFEHAGEELFFVGGFVRDKLHHDFMNDPVLTGDPLGPLVNKFVPNDVDFATSAKPEKTIEILKKNGLRAIPIGIEFGTVQTVIGDMKVEITTFRCAETYKKGSRKPSVRFGDNIEEDLSRRDFTFNAMAMRKDGSIIDPFGGHADLIQGLIHTPINPVESFSDDPLRMLRACRFEARGIGRLGWETGRAMTELAHKIKEVSAERVFEEVSKILMSPHPEAGLTVMVSAGLMAEVFPEIQALVEFRQNQGKWHSKLVWPHTLEVIKNSPPILEVRWAALFHDVAKPQTYSEGDDGVHFIGHEWKGALVWDRIAKRLRMGGEFQKHVNVLIREHLQFSALAGAPGLTNRSIRRFVQGKN
jgi:tRNA nucleotidyltransferase/poly(A) polymerase